MLVKTSQPNCEQWAWCVSKYLAASGHYFMVLRDWPIVYQFILLKTRLSMQYNYLCIFKLAHFLGSFWFPAVKSLFANPYKIFLFPWSQFFVTWAQFPVRLFSPSDIRKNCPTTFYCIFQLIWVLTESTKQMEQTLRAKVKIFFKSENLKNAFNKKWWAYRVYISQKKVGVAVIIYF